MKKYLILLATLFVAQINQAQEKTYGVDGEGLLERRGQMGSVVIIPFEDKMYMSDADNPIGRETGLKPGEIMTKFRNSLIESLELEMRKDWNITVFHEQMKLEEGFGLDYVYASVKYKYVAVPDDVLMANDTTIEKKDLKKKSKKKKESGIFEGQVVTHSDQQEKYMTLLINNDTLLKVLDSNLHSDYYLFLNEFDIRHHITNPDKIASGGLKYRLKVHFTCVDSGGNSLVSGAATSVVSAGSKNVYEIIRKGIPELSMKLSKMIRKYELDRINQ